MTARSSRAEVRNPILGLPALAALRDLDPGARRALRLVLMDLRADARRRADTCWRTGKPPLAAYWAAVAVYADHIARCLDRAPPAEQGRETFEVNHDYEPEPALA